MRKVTKNKLALLALAGFSAVASTGPAQAGMTVDSNGGLQVFEIEDDHYWFQLGGRLFFDFAWFDQGDNYYHSFPSGAQLRTGLIQLRGGVGRNWVYKMDAFFQDAPYNPGNVRIGEAFLAYNPCPELWFAVGQVGIPFGLEAWASGTDTPFMELSLPSDAFAPNNGLGIYGEWHGKCMTLSAALYRPAAGTVQYGDILSSPVFLNNERVPGAGPLGSHPGSDPLGAAARITYSPIHDDCTVLHAGFSARYENLHEHANYFQYYTRGELRTRQTPTFFTNIPANSADDHQVYGLELAGRWGPYLVQAEYMHAEVDRDDHYPVDDLRNPPGELDYHGYYVLGSWVVTGETKEYNFDSGTFGPVKPKCKSGAWEVLVRHSYVDLVDNAQLANLDPNSGLLVFPRFVDRPGTLYPTGVDSNDIVASIHSTSLGVTWWLNENIRFMANYVHSSISEQPSVDGFGVRAQVRW